MLDHERLDAYQRALQLLELSHRVVSGLPRGHADLADQLRRASLSIPLNIAEGAGKLSAKERARFHAIARGSAMECSAIFDALRIQQLLPPETTREAKDLCLRLVAMLSRMCR